MLNIHDLERLSQLQNDEEEERKVFLFNLETKLNPKLCTISVASDLANRRTLSEMLFDYVQ